MKKLFLGSVALLALGLGMPAAFAAEKALPAYTPPPPPVPVYTWSGCYVGASAGYSWGTSNRTAVVTTVPGGAGLPITGDFGLNAIGVPIVLNDATLQYIIGSFTAAHQIVPGHGYTNLSGLVPIAEATMCITARER